MPTYRTVREANGEWGVQRVEDGALLMTGQSYTIADQVVAALRGEAWPVGECHEVARAIRLAEDTAQDRRGRGDGPTADDIRRSTWSEAEACWVTPEGRAWAYTDLVEGSAHVRDGHALRAVWFT